MKNRRGGKKRRLHAKDFFKLSRSDAFYIFKVCILLIFLLCFYILNVLIYPEGVIEAHLARYQVMEMLSGVVASVFILFGSISLFYRVFWFFVQFVFWIFTVFDKYSHFSVDFLSSLFWKFLKFYTSFFTNVEITTYFSHFSTLLGCGKVDIFHGVLRVFHAFHGLFHTVLRFFVICVWSVNRQVSKMNLYILHKFN